MATAVKRRSGDTEKGGLFRIRIGDHLEDGPPGCECDGCLNGGRNHRYRARRFNPKNGEPMDPPEYDGDLIESKVDLVSRHGAEKFERVYPHNLHSYGYQPEPPEMEARPPAPQQLVTAPAPVTTGPSDAVTLAQQPHLESLSLPALKEYAQAEEIDLRGAKTKEEVIRIIRSHG